jgi:hypothetical protein
VLTFCRHKKIFEKVLKNDIPFLQKHALNIYRSNFNNIRKRGRRDEENEENVVHVTGNGYGCWCVCNTDRGKKWR